MRATGRHIPSRIASYQDLDSPGRAAPECGKGACNAFCSQHSSARDDAFFFCEQGSVDHPNTRPKEPSLREQQMKALLITEEHKVWMNERIGFPLRLAARAATLEIICVSLALMWDPFVGTASAFLLMCCSLGNHSVVVVIHEGVSLQ